MREKGMSLLEILVVISIFAILGILVTQSVVLTLQGSKKSESMVRARENLDYSLSIIERQVRGASSVSPCTGLAVSTISYLDQNGQQGSFSCVNTGAANSYIASGSANLRLTTDAVKVTSCSFVCSPATANNPDFYTKNGG